MIKEQDIWKKWTEERSTPSTLPKGVQKERVKESHI